MSTYYWIGPKEYSGSLRNPAVWSLTQGGVSASVIPAERDDVVIPYDTIIHIPATLSIDNSLRVRNLEIENRPGRLLPVRKAGMPDNRYTSRFVQG
jgi:hypothetical protein